MNNFKRFTSLLFSVSCLVFAIFIFVISIKSLKVIGNYHQSYYQLEFYERKVLIVQLIFSVVFFVSSIIGTTIVLTPDDNEHVPTRCVDASLLIIETMEMVQLIILFNVFKNYTNQQITGLLVKNLITAIVFLVLSFAILLIGLVAKVSAFGIVAVFFRILSMILPLSPNSLNFSISDYFYIIVLIFALFHYFSTMFISHLSKEITPSTNSKAAEVNDLNSNRVVGSSGIIKSIYYYQNEKGESKCIGSQTKVKIISINEDGTYNISYKEDGETFVVNHLDPIYFRLID